jgi:hypothetical protein
MSKWFPLSGVAFVIFGAAIQISGYQNPRLALALVVIGVLLLIAPVLLRLCRGFFRTAVPTKIINPRVTYEETARIIDIFKNAPPVNVAITTLTSGTNEQIRPVLECAGWLNEAFQKAGVVTRFTAWENQENVPTGTNIFWVKNPMNNEMVRRIFKAAEIKGLYPREVSSPVSKGCEVELMIGLNPYKNGHSFLTLWQSLVSSVRDFVKATACNSRDANF